MPFEKKDEDLYVIYECDANVKTKFGKYKMVLRLVSWDGKEPVIERRLFSFIVNKETIYFGGGWYPAKQHGLRLSDIQLINEHYDKIEAACKIWREQNDGKRKVIKQSRIDTKQSKE